MNKSIDINFFLASSSLFVFHLSSWSDGMTLKSSVICINLIFKHDVYVHWITAILLLKSSRHHWRELKVCVVKHSFCHFLIEIECECELSMCLFIYIYPKLKAKVCRRCFFSNEFQSNKKHGTLNQSPLVAIGFDASFFYLVQMHEIYLVRHPLTAIWLFTTQQLNLIFFFTTFSIIHWKASHQNRIYTSSSNGDYNNSLPIYDFRNATEYSTLNMQPCMKRCRNIMKNPLFYPLNGDIICDACKIESFHRSLDKITCVIKISYSQWILLVCRRPGCRVLVFALCHESWDSHFLKFE